MSNADQYMQEIAARRAARTQTTQVPGQPAHEVTVEQGSTPLARPSAAGVGQIDASMRGVNDTQVKRVHTEATTQIKMDDNKPENVVAIGALKLYPNPIANGFERNATKGGHDSHFVFVDGVRIHSEKAVGAIYEALLAEQEGK
jgi:hypothetical protein